MNPSGCGPPAPSLRGRRKGGIGSGRPQTAPSGRPIGDATAAQLQGPSPQSNRGAPEPRGPQGPSLSPLPLSPPTDGARPGPHPEPTAREAAPADASDPSATAFAAAARGGDMQMSQRSLHRRAAQAQVDAVPWCASAGGSHRALLHRRAVRFVRRTLLRRKISLLSAAITAAGKRQQRRRRRAPVCLFGFTCARNRPWSLRERFA